MVSMGPSDAEDAGAEAFNAFEASGWDRQAPTYDAFIGRVTSRLVDPLLDAAGVGSSMSVLDVATGPGYVAASAAERGADVVGIDIAPSMVHLARRLHPTVDFREVDAETLPFGDGTFDVVVSNFVIPHLGRHDRVIGELARVLRGGGRLAMTTWDTPDRMRLLGVVLDAFAEAGAQPPEGIPAGPPFFRYADEGAFAALLTGGGLTDVRVATVAFVHSVRTSQELWDGMFTGTVRTSALLVGQPESTRARIRAAIERLVQEYRVEGGIELPVSVKLATGTRMDAIRDTPV